MSFRGRAFFTCCVASLVVVWFCPRVVRLCARVLWLLRGSLDYCVGYLVDCATFRLEGFFAGVVWLCARGLFGCVRVRSFFGLVREFS